MTRAATPACSGTLPPHRGPSAALVFGDFTGYGGSYQRKVPLTISHLPQDLRRESMFRNFITHGVADHYWRERT
jgi:hypothetical protein